MRYRTGCESCRERHRRCTFPADGSTCYACQERGESCSQAPKFVFVSSSAAPPGSPSTALGRDGDDSTEGRLSNSHADGEVATPTGATDHADLGRPGSVGLGLDEREGQLFALYVRQLAPMMDSCDESRHFTLAVPRLALHSPIMLNSVLSLASRYDALHRNAPPGIESIRYNSHSIELLIRGLSEPPSTYGAELLVAVVMARSYEECDFESDLRHLHLGGTRRLLTHDTLTRLASEGGLAEAASWVHLRQSVYAYIVRGRPVDGHLDAFARLTAFRRTDDGAYANRMVYHFARVLRLYFSGRGQLVGGEDVAGQDWDGLAGEISEWFAVKPSSFEPVCYMEGSVEQFPTMVMLSAAPVMGLQYYYAAVIVMALTKSNNQEFLASNMFTLMGLALSNEHILDSFLLPTHMLSLCGRYIRHPQKRDHTLYFLTRVNQLVQWKTEGLIRSLQSQWSDAW